LISSLAYFYQHKYVKFLNNLSERDILKPISKQVFSITGVSLSKEEHMKVSIDADLCTGCGACSDDVPDVFELGDEIAEVKQPDVPADLEDAVRETAEGCPAEAIIIEE